MQPPLLNLNTTNLQKDHLFYSVSHNKMIMLTLSPGTSLSLTDSQNNSATDRMTDNMLKNTLQYLDITTRRHEDICISGLDWAVTFASKQICFSESG